MKTLIIIPSRMSASRLPGKPLLKINGLSIITHVFKRAESANIGEVIVATEDQEIIDEVRNNGGNAILTSKNHKTGTDRVYEAFIKIKKNDVDFIMNVQGDEPDIDINDIQTLDKKMKSNVSKIGTLAANIAKEEMFEDKNLVKENSRDFDKNPFPHAINFMRKTKDKVNVYHHMGIIYEIRALKMFTSLTRSKK